MIKSEVRSMKYEVSRRKILGKQGEELARQYLRERGYQILGINYHCRFGEIDIIAKQGNCLVFVEVKTRRQGVPEEAIDEKKQEHLAKAVDFYLRENDLTDTDFRIDSIGVVLASNGQAKIRHIEDIGGEIEENEIG